MILTTAMNTALQGATVKPRWLVYFRAKNRTTGLVENLGLWNDLDTLNVTIDGETRNYIGSGAFLQIPSLVYESGFNVQTQSLSLSMLSAEVIQLLREYDVRLAEVDIYLALFNLETNALIGTARAFKGWADELSISEDTDTITGEITLVSTARAGTKGLYTKQSDSSQKLRDATDRGREYADISGKTPVSWGKITDQVPGFKVGGGGENSGNGWFNKGKR